MQYRTGRGFERILRRLHPRERMEVQRHIDALVRSFEANVFPVGIGMTKLADTLWEFRVSLALRILFRWEGHVVTFLFVGNHNDVRQFLQHYR